MKRGPALFVAALVVTVVVATAVAQLASDQPDGLEYVAEQEGFTDSAQDHALAEAPLAGYGENLDGDGAAGRALSGFIGVVVTLAVGAGLFWLMRASKPGRGEAAES